MRGRPPSPKALNDLRGDPGRRRRYEKEPDAPQGKPTCPEHLDEIAKKEWAEITEILDTMGLLSKADRAMLEIYCVTYSRWRRAIDNLAKYGDMIVTKDKKIEPSPYVSQADRTAETCRKLLVEFGLSPAARARMRMPSESNKSGNKWLKIVG